MILKLLSPLLALLKWSAIMLTAVMLVIMVVQVFFRYVLNDSIVWAEELSTFMMMWVAFLVAPVLYRERRNVTITLLVEKFPPRMQQLLAMVMEVAILAVIAYFFNESLNVVQRGHLTKVTSVPITFFHVNLIVPISMVFMFWVGLVNFWEALVGFRENRKLDFGTTTSGALE
jgi:TRAP-type C4-dicarboxylate transport system permease small subunit